jgi:hypothetical protein
MDTRGVICSLLVAVLCNCIAHRQSDHWSELATHCACIALLPCSCLQLRIAGLSLQDSLQELRVKVAIQQSRTARLYNPMLEARIKALGERLMSTAARIGLDAAPAPEPAPAVGLLHHQGAQNELSGP